MKLSHNSRIIFLLGACLLLGVILYAWNRYVGVSPAPRSPAVVRLEVPVLLEEPETDAQVRLQAETDFTGLDRLSELKEAVQKQNEEQIEAALQNLIVHLEQHPGNLPGIIAALKAEKSPEMTRHLDRLEQDLH